jgi:hypothetical protein
MAPHQPLSVKVVVGGDVVVASQDVQGPRYKFSIDLPPGGYQIEMKGAAPITALVRAGQVTRLPSPTCK